MGERSGTNAESGGSHSLIVEPDDGRAAVLAAIEAATQSVDLTIYEITDSEIVGALVAAQQRKVAVRILYNWYSFSPADQHSSVLPTINDLVKGGVQCRPAPRNFEVTHEKAFVLDGTTAIIQSFNLSPDYFASTRDFGIVTSVPAEVGEVEAVFQADWQGQPISPSVDSLVWSPSNARDKLTSIISGARKTLEVYFEEVSDPGTLGALVAAARQGVEVRLICAVLATGSSTNGNAQGITYLRGGGVNAVSKSFPVSPTAGAASMYIHAKAIVADYGLPGAAAFVGSENLSCVSLNDNRECGILIEDPAILARIEATFTSDWNQPSVSVPTDARALSPCPGDADGRSRSRISARS